MILIARINLILTITKDDTHSFDNILSSTITPLPFRNVWFYFHQAFQFIYLFILVFAQSQEKVLHLMNKREPRHWVLRINTTQKPASSAYKFRIIFPRPFHSTVLEDSWAWLDKIISAILEHQYHSESITRRTMGHSHYKVRLRMVRFRLRSVNMWRPASDAGRCWSNIKKTKMV